MADLNSLSDHFNISGNLVLASTNCVFFFFIQFEIFLVLGVMRDFQMKLVRTCLML